MHFELSQADSRAGFWNGRWPTFKICLQTMKLAKHTHGLTVYTNSASAKKRCDRCCGPGRSLYRHRISRLVFSVHRKVASSNSIQPNKIHYTYKTTAELVPICIYYVPLIDFYIFPRFRPETSLFGFVLIKINTLCFTQHIHTKLKL